MKSFSGREQSVGKAGAQQGTGEDRERCPGGLEDTRKERPRRAGERTVCVLPTHFNFTL